uniref:Putative thymidylate synthase n=1 Tax=viral metagenome TaxID=1070528 RepID=A0A6M3JXB5_9ZZZZ
MTLSLAIISRDINNAFSNSLFGVYHTGDNIEVRGIKTKELTDFTFMISDPTKRFLTQPFRYNNIAATIAETFWVMAGRDDLEFLKFFLPNCIDYSDNGETWRGGYGPRLRKYHCDPKDEAINQIENVIEILDDDAFSRQAIIIIPYPDYDYHCIVQTKDKPCTISIQFLIRDKKLHCFVRNRSNDAIWGTFNINVFEWTFLQEIIAGILNVEIGEYHHNAISFHIYENMFRRTEKMLKYQGYNIYENDKDLIQGKPLKFNSVHEFTDVMELIVTLIENIINETKIYHEEEMYSDFSLHHNTINIVDYINVTLSYVAMQKEQYDRAYSLLSFVDSIKMLPLKICGFEYFFRFLKKNNQVEFRHFLDKLFLETWIKQLSKQTKQFMLQEIK